MPLINFRTDFKGLQYGADRPGGGNSGQPFVQFPIEDASTPDQFKRYYEANRTGLDFPVRGGAISTLLDGGTGVISSTIDRERIQKFFKSAPRGTTFIEKQKGLQLTNPRTQVPNSLIFNNQQQQQLGNIFLPVTNVYAPTNTLAQVQTMGTGAHFNRHGNSPTIYEAPQNTYAFIAGAPQNNTATRNRLAILKVTKLLQKPITSGKELANLSLNRTLGADVNLVDKMGISQFRDQIYNYSGGPGSVYGIGFTRVFRYTDTDAIQKSETNPDPRFSVQGVEAVSYSNVALTYQQIATVNDETNSGRLATDPVIVDFRSYLPAGSSPVSDYVNNNIANSSNGVVGLGIGNPGQPRRRVNYITDSTFIGQDQLNMIDPLGDQLFYNPSEQTPWEVQGQNSKDIIKFAFECIDNNNLGQSIALIFRAFIEGQITDNNVAEYNTFRYLGRGENFRTYQGFDRSIGFTFKVFAQSRKELLPMYSKLNQLISQVYPDYSEEYYMMRGNVVRLTIGDYIYRIPGFLENVNVTINNSTTPWEIVLNQYLGEGIPEDDVRELPHMVTVQCNFRPIMDILPRKVSYKNQFVPLIVNKDNYLNPAAINNDLKNQPVGADLVAYQADQAAALEAAKAQDAAAAAAAAATAASNPVGALAASLEAKLSTLPKPAGFGNEPFDAREASLGLAKTLTNLNAFFR